VARRAHLTLLHRSSSVHVGRKRTRRVAKRAAGGENLTPDDAHAAMERLRFSSGLSIETLSYCFSAMLCLMASLSLLSQSVLMVFPSAEIVDLSL